MQDVHQQCRPGLQSCAWRFDVGLSFVALFTVMLTAPASPVAVDPIQPRISDTDTLETRQEQVRFETVDPRLLFA